VDSRAARAWAVTEPAPATRTSAIQRPARRDLDIPLRTTQPMQLLRILDRADYNFNFVFRQ
jgi:hypothetical protein